MINLHSKSKPIKAFYARSKVSGNGGECEFIKINNKVGIKVYERRSLRDRAWERQKKFLKHKLAPKVGRKIRLNKIRHIGYSLFERQKVEVGEYVYGYLTQVADPVYDPVDVKIIKKLERLGFGDDIKLSNFGQIDGKIVFIDFGDQSDDKFSYATNGKDFS